LPQLHNHPSITAWVLFNEGWGAYDQERLAGWMKQLDPSRLLDAHTGRYMDVSALKAVAESPKWTATENGYEAERVASWRKHLDTSMLSGLLDRHNTAIRGPQPID